MSATPKNPLVGALVCFTAAAWVIAAPIIALKLDSFTPAWLGFLIMLGTWIVIIGIDQLTLARRADMEISQKVRPATADEVEMARNWHTPGQQK